MDELNRGGYNGAQSGPEAYEAPPKKQKKERRVLNLVTGIVVVLLAAFGVYRLVQMGVEYYKSEREKKAQAEAEAYYSYLIPAAAIDISPFDDITAADMSELVEMSVWSVLNSGLDPTQYVYEDDELLIPETQVERAFVHFFGTEKRIVHTTNNVYRIPLTTITPLYTPVIESAETKGDAVTLRVGYRNAGLYSKDPLTGTLTAPEPDKYVSVTLRNASTGTYISAVRAEHAPENAVGGAATPPASETDSAPAGSETASAEETAESGTAAE